MFALIHAKPAAFIFYSMESDMPYMRKIKKPKRHVLTLAVCAVVFTALLFGVIVEVCVRRPVLLLAQERTRALAAGTMSFAVLAALEEQQGDMLSVTQTEGESYLVIADTAKLNYVASLASADAQRRMEKLGKEGVTVELGDASGLAMLGGMGPKINVGFTTVGSITAETVSSLKSSGINQCIYSVDLVLTAHVQFAIAGKAKVVEVQGITPICQTVIVGKVPQVYTNVANEEDMLNLVPNDIP